MVAWRKDKFRDARIDPKVGQHEWIPTDLIDDMVERDRTAVDAEESADWLDAQHELRTNTPFLVFPPTKNKALGDAYAAYASETEGASVAKFIEDTGVKASSFALTGHTGSLYLRNEENKKVPQTGGQGSFHDNLRGWVKGSSTPKAYKTKLKAELKSLKLLWNGSLAALAPDGWSPADLEPIPVDYETSAGKDLGSTLKDYGQNVLKTYTKVLEILT